MLKRNMFKLRLVLKNAAVELDVKTREPSRPWIANLNF